MTPAELKRARQSLGLTQSQMAAMLGRKLRNYQQWEGDERKVDEAAARLLTAYLSGYRPPDWPE